MGQLEGKVCIITGGGTGIGKGIARAFAKEGATLVLAARQLDRLNDSAEEMRGYGAPTNVVQTDVTSEEQVKRLFETTITEYGKLDILVNNSGVFDGGPIDEIPLETWMKVINVNLTGVFLCTREAMRIMKPQRSGRIINIGSISSNMPRMNSAPYATSKHGIIGLTKSTALEGREYGISASAIHPGSRCGGMERILGTNRRGCRRTTSPVWHWQWPCCRRMSICSKRPFCLFNSPT